MKFPIFHCCLHVFHLISIQLQLLAYILQFLLCSHGITQNGASYQGRRCERHHSSILMVQMGLTPAPKQHYFGKPPKVWLNLHEPKDVKLAHYFMNKWEKKKYVMDSWHMNKSSISYEAIKIWPRRFADYWKPDGCENFERKPKGYERRFV